MDKNDFQKGQLVYLKYIGDRRNGAIGSITEATVKSIGSKYVTTTTISGNGYFDVERKFDINNDFREHYTSGGSDHQLYANRQDIEDENESLEIGTLIRSLFKLYSNVTKLPIDKLRRIKAIIEE